ncbi:MAG: hypothetical protein M1824_003312 [Vezdaea acicularis]|nr:MAG: hypothetical protein M1824_003312 [Vezdaea acicularis]
MYLISPFLLVLALRFAQSICCFSIAGPIPAPIPLPLIIWHGLGDTYDADGVKDVASLAQEVNPGTYVYVIRLSNDSSSDRTATFFGNLTLQIAQVCEDIATHPILSTAPGINALGFSQGGQFLRGYIERCNTPPVRSLVTFGSQHNGISRFQKCAETDWICQAANGLLRGNTWTEFIQSRVVPAQYFRDPEQIEEYLEASNFLADINNERSKQRNETYKKNLAKLKWFVMYMFEEDQTVFPKESSWFAEVNETDGTKREITWLRNRELYKDDWLGLKELDDRGALEFLKMKGGHMQLDEAVMIDTFKRFFGPDVENMSSYEDL